LPGPANRWPQACLSQPAFGAPVSSMAVAMDSMRRAASASWRENFCSI
jgi:hypothetical protein